jgi:hypothetical protein
MSMTLARGPDLRIRFAVAAESTADFDPRSTSVGHRTAYQIGQRSKPSRNSLPNAILSGVLILRALCERGGSSLSGIQSLVGCDANRCCRQAPLRSGRGQFINAHRLHATRTALKAALCVDSARGLSTFARAGEAPPLSSLMRAIFDDSGDRSPADPAATPRTRRAKRASSRPASLLSPKLSGNQLQRRGPAIGRRRSIKP